MSDNCLEFTVHNRYPDYVRPLRNVDWERPTLRELPRDTRYQPGSLSDPPRTRIWDAIELGFALAGALMFAASLVHIVLFIWE